MMAAAAPQQRGPGERQAAAPAPGGAGTHPAHATAHSRAEADWQRALQLEKRLKATYRKKSFYDPEARGLRAELRAAYEQLLFLDAPFAACNDVELLLWKSVFYRPIEEFRSRLKQADKAGALGAVQVPKVAAAFLHFLEDASLFYRRLVMQLQAAYGDVGVKLELPAAAAAGNAANGAGAGAPANGAGSMQWSAGSSAPRDVRPSVHRCLIYLGDLARYTAQAAPRAEAAQAQAQADATAASPAAAAAGGGAVRATPAREREWLRASHCYRLAARVLPRSGNPHNQLAVMAVMAGDELRAVYHYARSLCVGLPFTTARENLALLFEQNRARYAEFAAAQQQQQQQQQPHQQRQQPPAQRLLGELGVCFVRLSGLLYDRINAQEYSSVAPQALNALAALLGHPAALELLHRQSRADCTPLHLVVLGVFAVHNAHAGGGERGAAAPPAERGDAAARALQRSRSLSVLYGTGRLLAAAAAVALARGGAPAAPAAASASNPRSGLACLLVSLNVLLQWLAAQPGFAGVSAAHATEEELRARAAFWAAAARLVAAMARPFPSLPGGAAAAGQQQQQQQQHGSAGSAGGGSCDDGVLPEELELLGFEPLRSRAWMEVGKVAVDEPATRACRMMAAARSVAAALGGEQQQQQLRHLASAAAGTAQGAGGASQQPQAQTVAHVAAAAQEFSAAVSAMSGGQRLAAQQQRSSRAGSLDGAAAMDEDGGASHGAPAHATDPTAAALRANRGQQQQQQQRHQQQQDGEEDGAEEEVIVFRPRTRRASAPSSEDGSALPAAAAEPPPAGAAAPARRRASSSAPPAMLQPVHVPAPAAAAAAAEPPPLPQQLLASRQVGRGSGGASQSASGVSSPAAAASPQRQQRAEQPAAGRPALPGGTAPGGGAAGLPLQGHAATALDLQQAQAASDLLLARLAAKGAPAGAGGLSSLGAGGGLPPVPAGFALVGGGGPAAPQGFGAGDYGRGGLAPGPLQGSHITPALRTQAPSPAVAFGGGLPAAATSLQVPGSGPLAAPLPPGAGPGGAHHAAAADDLGFGLLGPLGLGLGPGTFADQQPPQYQHHQQQQGHGQADDGGFEAFDPLGFGLQSALDADGGGAAFAALLGAGASGAPAHSAPVSIAPHQRHPRVSDGGGHADAAYLLEQTARAAVDRILSPEQGGGGPTLEQLQRLQQQRNMERRLSGGSGGGPPAVGAGRAAAPHAAAPHLPHAYEMFGPGPDLFAPAVPPAGACAPAHQRRVSSSSAASDAAGVAAQQQGGLYPHPQQQHPVQQPEAAGASPPDGLTLLDYLVHQQRKGQPQQQQQQQPPPLGDSGANGFAAQQPQHGQQLLLQQGLGGAPGALFGARGPGVLLPPLDVVQSQNPFAP